MKNKTLNKITAWVLIAGLTMQATPVWALNKDETIYVKLNNDGSANNVIISEHLSDNGNSILKDKSNLDNIKNVAGDENFQKNNNEIVWETNGKDIYYQGTTKEEMPIKENIKYYLNGEEKNINEMIGASGKIKIVLSYENKLKQNVLINGRYEEIYTPFVIATTTILNNEDARNINVTNGKVIDNGNSSIVLALASPGLSQSLNLDMLNNLDEISISYETDNFELASIYSVATSKLFDESDLDIFDKTDKLYEAINTLSSSSGELVNGSKKLYDTLKDMIGSGNTLSKEQLNAIEKQAVAAATLSNEDIKAKIKEVLNNLNIDDEEFTNIMNEVINNLNISDSEKQEIIKLITNSIKIDSSEIHESLIKVVQNIKISEEQKELIVKKVLETISFTDEQLENIAKMATSSALENVKNSEEYKKAIEKKEAFENSGIENVIKVCTADNVNPDNYEMCVNNIENIANYKQIVGSIKTMEETAQKVASGVSKTITSQINSEITKQISKLLSDEMIKQITNEIVNKVTEEVSKILNSYVTEENINMIIGEINKQIKDNVANKVGDEIIKQVLPVISDNVAEVLSPKLTPIVNKITNEVASKVSVQVASNVADQVKDTVITNVNSELIKLVNGLEKFDKEGIQKLTATINGDVKDIEARMEALINLSNKYKTFDDIEDESQGSSKIIMIVDAIKKEEEKKVNDEKIVEEKKSFGQKIKGLFTK